MSKKQQPKISISPNNAINCELDLPSHKEKQKWTKCSYEELENDVVYLHKCNYKDGERIEELEFTIEDLEEQLEKLKEILKVKGCEYQKN